MSTLDGDHHAVAYVPREARHAYRRASLVTVACHHCGGTGKRALTHTEWTTLEAVMFGWSQTSEIRARLGLRKVKNEALCNRLVDLVRIGLVESRVCETNHRIKEWRRLQ